jgi:outer membrane protein OmpA-like peptidoglycan-associated protein
MRASSLLALFLVTPAAAQTFDGSGPVVPPLGVNVADPLLGWGAARPGTASVTVLGEGATNPLVYELRDGDRLLLDPVVGSLFGANVQARGTVSRWLELGASLPVWLATDGIATGAAVGDAHLWAPVRAYSHERFRVAVVPFARLPTGPDARYLGDPAGGGLLGSVGVEQGPLFAHADLGFDAGAPTGNDDWAGSVRARFALDGGVRVGESVAVHGEVRGRTPLGAAASGVPTEGVLSLRGRAAEQVALSVGAGRAITRGVGAGSLRLFVGATLGLGGGTEDPADRFAPVAKEVREVNVIDPLRLPIRGATVVAGGTEVTTDHEGFADLPIKAVRDGQLTVSAPGYLPVTRPISVDDPYWEVQLQRAPVPVAVSVVGPDGTATDAQVTVVGPAEAGDGVADGVGLQTWELGPGEWTVAIEAEGYGRQERTITVSDDRVDPIRVDAILTPVAQDGTSLKVEVVDALGRPVEDAVVAVENRDLGTTGSGGDLTVDGLAAGEHAIVVRSNRFGQAVVQEVTVGADASSVVVPLQWQAGSVLVQVDGPDGKPTDATVSLTGPDALPQRAVGPDGEELFVLRPGEWEVTVQSPTLAPQTRTVVIDETEGKLVTLQLGLLPEEDGDADLDIVVVDPDGWPVEGLSLSLDGMPAGRTGPDGSVQLRDLQRGVRFVQVAGPLTVPRLTEVDLVGDHQQSEVVVWWVDGVVDLVVSGPEGGPLDATVTPEGPSPYPAFATGLDGMERRVFPEGEWSFTVSAPGLAERSQQVAVASGTHRRQRVSVQLAPPAPKVGALRLSVVDPTGQAPEQLSLSLEGVDAGDVVGGSYALQGVPLGPLTVAVDGPGLAPLEQTVEVVSDTEVVLEPRWARGALRVAAVGPEGPVSAQLTVRGPIDVPTVELTGGARTLELAPGTFTLVARHDGLATAEQTVTLPDREQLTEVTLRLTEEKPVLRLGVLDPDQRPVAGAEVRMGEVVVGTTDEAGRLSVDTVPSVATQVQVVPSQPGLKPVTLQLEGSIGEQQVDVVAPYAPREVAVKVVDAEGAPVKGAVAAYGGVDETAEQTVDGAGAMQLSPGTYTVTGRSDDGRVGTARVEVPADPSVAAEVVVEVAAVEARADGDVLRPVAPILFDLDSAVLRDDALAVIADMASWLRADRSAALVEVAGHTDDQGGVVYNQQLSERRALAVRAALAARGVAPERLVARGYGLSRPATSGTDEEARQLNRRVELSVLRRAE